VVRGAPGRIRRRHGESLRSRRGARRAVIAELPENWSDHVGRRVTMRWVNRDAERTHSEVFGVLQSVSDPEGDPVLKVMDKRGRSHTVRVKDIVAARVLG